MKKQIIFEYDIKDDVHRITVSTPHHNRFDIYLETGKTLQEVSENIIKLIDNDSKFFLDFFQPVGFSLDIDLLERNKKLIENNENTI